MMTLNIKEPITLRSLLITSVMLFVTALISGCQDQQQLSVQEIGTLKVVSRNGPTTYYEDRSGATGFEYELVHMFADYLEVELEIIPLHSLEEIFTTLDQNEAHLAAAGLTVTAERQKRLNFSENYMEIDQYIVYRTDRPRPKTIEDISNQSILVIANSSHQEILEQLSLQNPDIQFRTATDVETIDLMDMLNDGEIDFTILDSNEFIANRGFYPRLDIAFKVGEPGQLAWALPGTILTPGLTDSLASFFRQVKDDGRLRQLQERFYGHSEQVNQMGSLTFSQAVEKRLPKYQQLIQSVAEEYEIDWRLLAAHSYQESYWNPKAKSPTGVRGMMMLTLPTAKEMGVKNRLDASQSLRGGARYFNRILKLLPEQIKEPDRTWFALAAYNVGRGHLEDARIITEQQGKDPNRWADVKDTLPLLRKHRWYKNTRHGYARGDEPVTYVHNIRHYYNLLNWQELAKNRTPPPQQVDQYLPQQLRQEFKSL